MGDVKLYDKKLETKWIKYGLHVTRFTEMRGMKYDVTLLKLDLLFAILCLPVDVEYP